MKTMLMGMALVSLVATGCNSSNQNGGEQGFGGDPGPLGVGGAYTGGTGDAGGTGGTGGQGGAGGGEPSWAEACTQACAKADNECGQTGYCLQPSVDIDCTEPPADPFKECTVRCLLEDDSGCSDVLDWLPAGDAPPLGSKWIQCLSNCAHVSTSPGVSQPSTACTSCLVADSPAWAEITGCISDTSCCTDQAACDSWLSCTTTCSEPSCYTQCDADHPTASPLQQQTYDTICNTMDTTAIGELYGGDAPCYDVCNALTDACNK